MVVIEKLNIRLLIVESDKEPYEKTVRKLAISWGVKPVLVNEMKSKEGLVNLANVVAKENGIAAGEKVLVTGGTPGVTGQTNYLELVTVK